MTVDLSDHLASLESWRASGAVLIRDQAGRVLILRTTYKEHWELPGGGVEPGETPRQGAEREAREELGIVVGAGRMLCVDHVPARPARPTPMLHFIFDAPPAEQLPLAAIRLQGAEIAEYRLVEPASAERLLGTRVGPRTRQAIAAADAGTAAYLERGRP